MDFLSFLGRIIGEDKRRKALITEHEKEKKLIMMEHESLLEEAVRRNFGLEILINDLREQADEREEIIETRDNLIQHQKEVIREEGEKIKAVKSSLIRAAGSSLTYTDLIVDDKSVIWGISKTLAYHLGFEEDKRTGLVLDRVVDGGMNTLSAYDNLDENSRKRVYWNLIEEGGEIVKVKPIFLNSVYADYGELLYYEIGFDTRSLLRRIFDSVRSAYSEKAGKESISGVVGRVSQEA